MVEKNAILISMQCINLRGKKSDFDNSNFSLWFAKALLNILSSYYCILSPTYLMFFSNEASNCRIISVFYQRMKM